MTCGLSPAVCCLSDFGVPPDACATENFNCDGTEPTRPDLVFGSGLYRRFGTVEFDASGKPNPFSSAMSVTRNLVSDRARRIPARVFKIHEQGALAMNFTTAAVTEIIGCVALATPRRRYFIQRVESRAEFRRRICLAGRYEGEIILKFKGRQKCLSHMHFRGPCFAFLLSLYRREKKSERIFG